jgi:PBP1b-binding outer membrane lipoprotein LpoB
MRKTLSLASVALAATLLSGCVETKPSFISVGKTYHVYFAGFHFTGVKILSDKGNGWYEIEQDLGNKSERMFMNM